MSRRAPFLLILAAVSLTGGLARAQDDVLLSGTLKTIRDRGTILIGHRENSVPFSFLNRAKQPVGFSIEICRGIAADVARRLNRDLLEPDSPAWQDGVRIGFVPVAADARLPSVTSGKVDLECGSTTATDERAKSVAFSPVFFLAGTKLLVPIQGGPGGAVSSYRGLAGKTVAVSAGTTNGDVMRRLAANLSPPIKVQEVASVDAAYDALVAGTADAVASDDILLYALKATRPDGGHFRVVGDYLSFEPYAIMFRRDDAEFAALVRASFERMAQDGVLLSAYARWFTEPLPTGQDLDLPMSPQLSEMYRALGQPD